MFAAVRLRPRGLYLGLPHFGTNTDTGRARRIMLRSSVSRALHRWFRAFDFGRLGRHAHGILSMTIAASQGPGDKASALPGRLSTGDRSFPVLRAA